MGGYLLGIDNGLTVVKLNASFIGINAHNNLEDLMRSVFEGVALGHRDNIESLKKCGFVRSKARFTGGAAKSKAWCEIFTDAIGIEIETVKSKQAGALGAAIVAGIAAGVYKDCSDAVAKVVEIENSYKPVANNTIIYNKKYDKFKKLIEALNL